MKLDVKLFAAARQLACQESVPVTLDSGATVADLRRALEQACPSLQPLLGHVLFAVDQQYATDQTPLSSEMEVACIPPVSGG